MRQVVLQDLENAMYLCEYVAAQKPEHDFRELLREWIDETKRELDFEREALNTDLVGDALRSCAVVDFGAEAEVFSTSSTDGFCSAPCLDFAARFRAACVSETPDAIVVAPTSAAEDRTTARHETSI